MNYIENYNLWRNSDKLSDAEKQELDSIASDEKEIKSRFSSYLSFGTAGLRGTMKVGMNAMNAHTVAHATQGLAALIIKEGRMNDGVAIACDSRINSTLFARISACVLAANGIKGVGKTLKDFSLPISMSFRLFGALLSGLLVTELVYYYSGLSFVLPVVVAVLFTLLHALIQTYVLTMLTSLFYGEVSEIHKKNKKIKGVN